jgi:hypothetical protein
MEIVEPGMVRWDSGAGNRRYVTASVDACSCPGAAVGSCTSRHLAKPSLALVMLLLAQREAETTDPGGSSRLWLSQPSCAGGGKREQAQVSE